MSGSGKGAGLLDLKEVALAALLYNVGDLAGFEKPTHGTALQRVVSEADGLASMGDGSSNADAPLNSIFDFIGEGSAQRRSYRFEEYGKDIGSYFPAREGNGSNRELKAALARALRDAPVEVQPVLNVLERYGSYMRSATGAAEVSLFDHARTTAAIAVCIAGRLNETETESVGGPEDEPYLFVRGDISGVQGFIYTISSKGALRMLRARSFFLELVAEHAVARILELSGVPRTNVILVGGGAFQLLLPNTKESQDAVEQAGATLNADLENRFGRGLYLALAKTPCAASGIARDGLARTLANLGNDLSAMKARKFKERLPHLLGERSEPGLETCDVCSRDDVSVGTYEPKSYEPWRDEEGEEPLELCETCHMLARASLELVRGKYLVRGDDLRIGGTGYGLTRDSRNALYALDGVVDEACLGGAVPLPAARYAVRDGDQIMNFEDISKKAEGIPRLAVLRMDVDNLGDIFRAGLPANMRSFDRYASLSRSFTTFFKMVLPLICSGGYEGELRLFGTEGERAATVVYSGGDDLFIVGAWSEVLELAVDIRLAFREFVCENPSVTLSGGISIHKAGEPLYLMAEAAGAAEEAAKKNEQNGRKKDSAVLFYEGSDARKVENTVPEALFWDEVEGVVKLLKQINAFRGPDGKLPFPRGFTRLLLEVVDVYEQEGHLSLPRLAYALARMEESGKLSENRDWQGLKRKLLEIGTIEKQLRPAATWLDLAEREREA